MTVVLYLLRALPVWRGEPSGSCPGRWTPAPSRSGTSVTGTPAPRPRGARHGHAHAARTWRTDRCGLGAV